MPKETSGYVSAIDDLQNWDVIQGRRLISDIVGEVIKFHQRTTNIPRGIRLGSLAPEVAEWIEVISGTDIRPAFVLERLEVSPVTMKHQGSARIFNPAWTTSLQFLSNILFTAFGRDQANHKRYPSAGALYCVIPVLCVFSDTTVYGVTAGSFALDQHQPALLRLQRWTAAEIADSTGIASVTTGSYPSSLAIAYAVDMRRALTKYGVKGYRHALIEIGLMAQSFRESLREIGERENIALGERCWSGFADNAMTAMVGLDVRMAPVSMLQWFGLRSE